MRKSTIDEMIEKGASFYSNNMHVGVYSLAPNATGPLHLHPGSDSFHYVIEGEGKFLVDDKEFPISKGSVIHCTPMTRYGIKNGQKEMKMLCVHAPMPVTFREGDKFICNKCGMEVEILKACIGSLICCGVEMNLRSRPGLDNQMIVKEAIPHHCPKYSPGDELTCKYCGTRIRFTEVGSGGPVLCCGFEL